MGDMICDLVKTDFQFSVLCLEQVVQFSDSIFNFLRTYLSVEQWIVQCARSKSAFRFQVTGGELS